MRRATSLELYRYWNAVRGHRSAPRRFEIEPSDISDLLPETLILETQADASYHYRLAGTRICEMFGQEFRGSAFLDGWTEPDRETLLRRLRLIKERGAVLCFEFDVRSTAGHTATFECLVMPLHHATTRVDRFLGCMGPVGEGAKADVAIDRRALDIAAPQPPDWIGDYPVVARSLGAFEVIWPDTTEPVDPSMAAGETAPDHDVPADAFHTPSVRMARIVRDNRRQFRVYDGGLAGHPADDA
ncbi:MAG: PAS domain-containing protein [Pseudomonadota bacterium]